MSSEHVEVLRDIRNWMASVYWDSRVDALDAAIAALSAPQPPAEAMEAWHSAMNDVGELRANAPDERYAKRAARVESWIKANRPEPPSAPVGVEAAEHANVLRDLLADEYSEREDDGSPSFTLERAALQAAIDALAQQPAAVDGDKPYPAPRNRQEAAALAKLALAYLGVTSAHIDAAVARCETDLAGQPGGSDNDR